MRVGMGDWGVGGVAREGEGCSLFDERASARTHCVFMKNRIY